jgi:hypothetical protein
VISRIQVYRWSFVANTLSPGLKLAEPTGEAYTSTLIGPDGAVYAINNAQLACYEAHPISTSPVHGRSGLPILDHLSRFGARGFQGAAWIGILAAFSLHVGIKVSRRLRTFSGNFLSGCGVSRSSRRASVASSTAS